MKNFTKIGLLAMLASAVAFAEGASDGGGGDAVLCYQSQETRDAVEKNIKNSNQETEVDLHLDQLSAKPVMLDIYDAKDGTGLFQETETKIIDRSAETIYKMLYETQPTFAVQLFNYVNKDSQWEKKRYGVLEVNDEGSRDYRIGASCVVVQVAFRDDEESVINYDPRIVELMDFPNKTALKLHEDIYYFQRRISNLGNHILQNQINNLKKLRENATPDAKNQIDRLLEMAQNDIVTEIRSKGSRRVVRYLMTKEQYSAEEINHVGQGIDKRIRLIYNVNKDVNGSCESISYNYNTKLWMDYLRWQDKKISITVENGKIKIQSIGLDPETGSTGAYYTVDAPFLDSHKK